MNSLLAILLHIKVISYQHSFLYHKTKGPEHKMAEVCESSTLFDTLTQALTVLASRLDQGTKNTLCIANNNNNNNKNNNKIIIRIIIIIANALCKTS